MFVASYSRTMSSARMKVEDEKPLLVDILSMRRQKAAERAAEDLARAERQREIIARERAEAEASIRAANAALSNLHKAWADAGEGDEDVAPTAPKISVHRIMRRICRATGISEHEIMSNRRYRPIVLARQAIMYWACRRTLRSLPEIGRALGGRDHTTVLHAKHAYVAKRKAMGRNLKEVR